MQILFVPVPNFPANLDADSIYNISVDLCDALALAYPQDTIHLVLPDLENRGLEMRYKAQPLRSLPENVVVHRAAMFSRFSAEEIHVDQTAMSRFHPMYGKLPVDVVVSTSAIKSLVLKSYFGSLTYGPRPHMVNYDLLVRGYDEGGEVAVTEWTDAAVGMQSISQVAFHNLWESGICRSISVRAVAETCSPAKAASLLNDPIIYSGFPSERVRELGIAHRYSKFSVLVRGRMTGSKRYDLVLDTYNKVYASGRAIDVIITTGTGGLDVRSRAADALAQNPRIEVIECPTVDRSLRVMEQCHAFLFWSRHELFCVSLWEMLASGLIGVIKREEWNKDLLPPNYPLLFDTPMEAYALLADVYDNYPVWFEKLAWVRQWVRDRYSYAGTAVRMRDALTGVVEKFPVRPITKDWLKRLAGKQSATLSDCHEAISSQADLGGAMVADGSSLSTFNARKIGNAEIVAEMRNLGFVDKYRSNSDGGELYFVKPQ